MGAELISIYYILSKQESTQIILKIKNEFFIFKVLYFSHDLKGKRAFFFAESVVMADAFRDGSQTVHTLVSQQQVLMVNVVAETSKNLVLDCRLLPPGGLTAVGCTCLSNTTHDLTSGHT